MTSVLSSFPVDCKTVVFLRWSVKQMRAVFERKIWSECENGEWNLGETLYSRLARVRLAREDPRFAPCDQRFREKQLFCSLLFPVTTRLELKLSKFISVPYDVTLPTATSGTKHTQTVIRDAQEEEISNT